MSAGPSRFCMAVLSWTGRLLAIRSMTYSFLHPWKIKQVFLFLLSVYSMIWGNRKCKLIVQHPFYWWRIFWYVRFIIKSIVLLPNKSLRNLKINILSCRLSKGSIINLKLEMVLCVYGQEWLIPVRCNWPFATTIIKK